MFHFSVDIATMIFACLAVLLVATGTSEECCPPPQFESRAAGRGLELSENGGDPYSVSHTDFSIVGIMLLTKALFVHRSC